MAVHTGTTNGSDSTHDMVDTYAITLPSQWSEVPLDGNERHLHVRALKRSLAKTAGWSKTQERRLDLSLAHFDNSLAAINASFAGAYVDLWSADDVTSDLAERDSGEPLLVTANCAIGTMSRKGVGHDLPLNAPTLLIAASSERASAAIDPRVVGTTNLEPPKLVELGPGKAVRLRRHQFVRTSLGKADGVYTETYLVPHSEAGDHACILSFGTTSVKLTTDFAALFEKVASTLQFFRPDDPTTVERES